MTHDGHHYSQDCNCTTCFMNRVKTTRKYVNKAMAGEKTDIIKMETIEGTKLEDDGEDGCYIDYEDLHKKRYNKSNSPEEPVLIKHPTYNNGLAYDKHLELNSHINEIDNNSIPIYVNNDQIRKFDSGATRDTSEGKIDFEGFISPIVLEEFGKYMLKHQKQSNGELRPSDNWQKGMPRDVYMKSAWRHFHDWWMEHRGYDSREGMKDALNGLLFNLMGYMHELLLEERKNNESK